MKNHFRNIFRLVFIVFVFSCFPVLSEEIILPSQEILLKAKELSYNDFPKTIDIISIIRVESNFDPKAFNPEISKNNKNRKIPPSVGLMQVQGGSYNVDENMREGVSRLRKYFLMFGSKKAAVMSYNIGPSNYKKRKYIVSGIEYWEKFKKRKKQYKLLIKD